MRLSAFSLANKQGSLKNMFVNKNSGSKTKVNTTELYSQTHYQPVFEKLKRTVNYEQSPYKLKREFSKDDEPNFDLKKNSES